jgi:D-alanyl-D-alanine carboxypeptidase/Putative peptidoglycan binding domain
VRLDDIAKAELMASQVTGKMTRNLRGIFFLARNNHLLKAGTISQEVARWQRFLNLTPDGIFGERTVQATKAWQSKNGLRPDGIVGESSFALAAEQGYKTPVPSYFPPRPAFNSPTNQEREQMFGRFAWKRKNATDIIITDDWAVKNITKVQIPQIIGIEGAPKDGYIYFHKNGAAQLKAFFNEVERAGLKHLLISWAGSFYPRFIRGSQNTLSNHSWGTAFDINAPQNWLGQRPAPEGARGTLLRLVPIANRHGFYWGGHYNSRLDGMHFELAVLKSFHNLTESEINNVLPAETQPSVSNQAGEAGTLDVVPASASTEGTQTAENITNIETGDKNVPDNFVPENIPLNAPAPDNSTATATRLTIAGVTLPLGLSLAIKAFQDFMAQGFVSSQQIGELAINFLMQHTRFIFYAILLIIVGLILKKAWKQLSFMLQMFLTAKADSHNPIIIPMTPEQPTTFFGRLRYVFTGK